MNRTEMKCASRVQNKNVTYMIRFEDGNRWELECQKPFSRSKAMMQK